MKTLKVKSILFSLLAMMAVAVFMTSCERESIVEDDVSGWKEQPSDNFVSAEQSTEEVPNISEFAESVQNEDIELRACNCGAAASSLGLAVSPSGLINLNIKYKLGESDHEVRVFHFRRVGNSWTYYGYDRIGASTLCVNKSVNMSTGQLPSGDYWSGAIVYDPSTSYCGTFKTLLWSK